MRPLLLMEKSVEVAKAEVEEEIVKSVVGVVPEVEEATKSERRAKGEEVPTPTLPPTYAFPVVVAPPEMVRPPVWVPEPMVEEAERMTLWMVEVGVR